MTSDNNREYIYLEVFCFDFENSEYWEEYNGTYLCDLCFENKSNYVVFTCCSFEGGRIGGGGGGDIYVYYCNDCKNKKKRKHVKKYNVKAYDNAMILLKKLSIIDDEPYIIPIDQGMVEMNFYNFICVVKEDKVSIKNRNTDEIYLFDWNDLDLCVNTILNLEKKE
jgi:hypothetical protein